MNQVKQLMKAKVVILIYTDTLMGDEWLKCVGELSYMVEKAQEVIKNALLPSQIFIC